MRKIRLDDGRYIELPSAKVREFARVYELATKFLQASNEEEADGVVGEITEAWAQSLDPGDLTLDDAWEILLAKAGPKANLLDALRDIMAEAMRDFVSSDQGRGAIRDALEETTSNSSGASA